MIDEKLVALVKATKTKLDEGCQPSEVLT